MQGCGICFVDGHLDVERAEIGQKPEDPICKQLKGKEDAVIAKVEGETLSKCHMHLAAGVFVKESKSRTGNWAGWRLRLQYNVRSAIGLKICYEEEGGGHSAKIEFEGNCSIVGQYVDR